MAVVKGPDVASGPAAAPGDWVSLDLVAPYLPERTAQSAFTNVVIHSARGVDAACYSTQSAHLSFAGPAARKLTVPYRSASSASCWHASWLQHANMSQVKTPNTTHKALQLLTCTPAAAWPRLDGEASALTAEVKVFPADCGVVSPGAPAAGPLAGGSATGADLTVPVPGCSCAASKPLDCTPALPFAT